MKTVEFFVSVFVLVSFSRRSEASSAANAPAQNAVGLGFVLVLVLEFRMFRE
jgi:hypothetical protein